MTGEAVLLTESQRQRVEVVCHEHARIRNWTLHAVNVRSNHVHLVDTADQAPAVVRDQSKANSTRVLRSGPEPILSKTVWTRGGDCEIVDGDENLCRVVEYVKDVQDRKGRDQQ